MSILIQEKITAVVFDMDGVLFDTERLCTDSWIEVAKEHQITDIKEVIVKCVGLNRNDTQAIFRDKYGENFAYDRFHDETSLRFKDKIKREGLPIKKGVHEILEFLKKEGYQIGLASSTRRGGVIGHTDTAGITDYFQVIVGGDMVEHSKPNPDIYLIACDQLGVAPKNAIAIEDSPNGIRSAYAAGMKPVMVPDLIAPTPEIQSMLYLQCDSLLDVIQHLQQAQKGIKDGNPRNTSEYDCGFTTI